MCRGVYFFFYGKGNESHRSGTGFLYIRESYQQLRKHSNILMHSLLVSKRAAQKLDTERFN
jgi:hypothetical protein